MKRPAILAVLFAVVWLGTPGAQEIETPPLPPLSVTDPSDCSNYQKAVGDFQSRMETLHANCLDAHSKEPSVVTNGVMVCSHPECQSLHDYVFGNSNQEMQNNIAACYAAAAKLPQAQQNPAGAQPNPDAVRQQQAIDRIQAQLSQQRDALNRQTQTTEAKIQREKADADRYRALGADADKARASIAMTQGQTQELARLQESSDRNAGVVLLYPDSGPADDGSVADLTAIGHQELQTQTDAGLEAMTSQARESLAEGLGDWLNSHADSIPADLPKTLNDWGEQAYDLGQQVQQGFNAFKNGDQAGQIEATGNLAQDAASGGIANPVARAIARKNLGYMSNVHGNVLGILDSAFGMAEGSGAENGSPSAGQLEHPEYIFPGVEKLVNAVRKMETGIQQMRGLLGQTPP